MYTVIATFPATDAARETVSRQVLDSTSMLETAEGCVAWQALRSPVDDTVHALVMTFTSEEAFLAMARSEESRDAHADVDMANYTEPPTVRGFEVIAAGHPTAEAAA